MTPAVSRIGRPAAVAGLVPLLSAATVGLAALSSPGLALATIGAGALLVLLVAKPWAALPVILLGGAVADRAVATASSGVTGVVAVRAVLIGIACAAIAVRRLRAEDWGPRVRTPADVPAIVLVCLVATLSVWGLAAGHAPHQVVVATYHLLVLPLYFFLATFTLNTPERLWETAKAFLVGSVVFAIAVHIGTTPRQGGLFSSFAIVGLLALAGSRQTRPVERFGLAVFGAALALDIFLSGYRSVWLASSIAVAMLVVLAPRTRRPLVALAVVLLAVAVATLALDSRVVTSRANAALSHAGDSSGYRNSESRFGLAMVASSPLLGNGIGRAEPDRFVETFGYREVGPILHVFYLTVLVNTGFAGLVLVLLFICTALKPRAVAASRDGPLASVALGTRCLLVGWCAAAFFAAPTDGHWELGVLPALALILDGFRDTREPSGALQDDLDDVPERVSPPSEGLGAIVVSYNSAAELPRSIPPLLDAGAEVWLVDNASRDASVDLVRARFPGVHVIENPTNAGFGAANNRAIEQVSGDVVLLVNPDCELDPRSAGQLAEYLRAHPDTAIVGPRIEDRRGEVLPSAHRFETAASVIFMLCGGRTVFAPGTKRLLARMGGGRSSYDANFASEPSAVDWVSGACIAARTSVLLELGGFDEGYFLFMEDEALCARAWEHGWKVVSLPSARARHLGGASSGDRAFVWPEFYRSLLRFQALSRPRTYSLVRAAVAGRAVAGIGLGAVRELVYVAQSRPRQHRATAWRRILRLALKSPHHTLAPEPQPFGKAERP